MSRPKRNEIKVDEPYASIIAQLQHQQADVLLEMIRGPAMHRIAKTTGIFQIETKKIITQKKDIREVEELRTPKYRIFEVK